MSKIEKKERKKFWRLSEAREFCEMFDLPEPLKRFNSNKHNAISRGIEWNLTFDEWWALWKPYYHLRGHGKGKMNLCRDADQGAYEVGNVRIDTFSANMAENGRVIHLSAKVRRATKKNSGTKQPYSKHAGYVKHLFELPIAFMNPMAILSAKQELKQALQELNEELNPVRKRPVYIDFSAIVREQQKNKSIGP